MIRFLCQMAMIVITAYVTAWCWKKNNKNEDKKPSSLDLLYTKRTKTFLKSFFFAMCGVYWIPEMMHGNLQGIIYPTWQVVVGYILFGQFIPVEAWYLWHNSKSKA